MCKAPAQATFNGDGILKGLQVIGTSDGLVKGKVGNSLADPPLRPDGKLNVGGAIGKGDACSSQLAFSSPTMRLNCRSLFQPDRIGAVFVFASPTCVGLTAPDVQSVAAG